MAKRYFEYKDAKSKKFWEVSVSGKKVNIHYGKIGTDGQTSLKELDTPAEAKAHAEKQAAGKVKKGYKEAKVKAVKKVAKKAVKKKVAKKAVKKKAVKKKVVKKTKEKQNTTKSPLTKKQIKEFKEEEKEAEDSYGFRSVADYIAEAGDKEWAKKVYVKSEGKAEDYSDFSDLAGSIHERLGDKEWAEKNYKKAEGKAEGSQDFLNLADSIHEQLGDKEWAEKNYKKAADKAEDFSDFSGLADTIYEQLGDKEWAKKVYKRADDKAKDFSDFIVLADNIYKNLGDKEWAAKLYKKAVEPLDPIEKKIYEKLESLITDNKSIDALGSFDEDLDNYCIQSWLVEFVLNEGLYKDIFDSKNYKKEDIKELETMFLAQLRGGGFRPTVLLDYDDNPDFYGVAESAEGDFNELEFKATFYAGIIAGKLGFDISPIIDHWEENGWDDYIKALKTLIDS